jgi:hypothetical protein
VWFVPNAAATSDHRLTTPPIMLPGSLTWHQLEFRQTYAFDQTLADGGVLELSQDDGASWHDIGPQITRTQYSGTLIPASPTQTNPLAGRPAYVGGVVGSPALVYVDLTPWAGQTVRLRWRFGSDAIGAATGWYVDGIAITAVEPGLMPGTRWYLF